MVGEGCMLSDKKLTEPAITDVITDVSLGAEGGDNIVQAQSRQPFLGHPKPIRLQAPGNTCAHALMLSRTRYYTSCFVGQMRILGGERVNAVNNSRISWSEVQNGGSTKQWC